MYGVGVCDRFSFVSDPQNGAFFRMKFHFIVGLPLLQCVKAVWRILVSVSFDIVRYRRLSSAKRRM